MKNKTLDDLHDLVLAGLPADCDDYDSRAVSRAMVALDEIIQRAENPEGPKKAWVLLIEYNEYDQHGAYFVAWFARQPTLADLGAIGVPAGIAAYVLSGGGRQGKEDSWLTLREVVAGEDYSE